jgi:hypothetical protein
MKKNLKTLDKHNSESLDTYRGWQDMSKPQRNGIGCPKCGEELWDSSPMSTLTSNPPQKNVHCDCGYRGYRLT